MVEKVEILKGVKMSSFKNKIEANLDENRVKFLRKVAYKITCENLKNKNKIEIFQQLFSDLKDDDLCNKDCIKSLILGMKYAISSEKESEISLLMSKIDKIKKDIEDKKNQLNDEIAIFYDEILKNEQNEELKDVVNELILEDIKISGILKEISQSIFLSIIEQGKDIEESIEFSAKNIVSGAINEDDFKKERILKIVKIVICEGLILANESKIFADSIVKGVISGANDGIQNAIGKFKDDIRFVPNELGLREILKELQGIEDDFVELLKEISKKESDFISPKIDNFIALNYENYIAKFKKISASTQEQILQKIEEFDLEKNYQDLAQKAKNFQTEFTLKSAKLKENLQNLKNEYEIEQKFANLKSEFDEFEKKSIEKFKEFLNKIKK